MRYNEIRVKGIYFSYGDKEIFHDFSFRTSSRVAVLKGPSGCGKTTLLKILSGNLKPQNRIDLPDIKNTLLILQEDALVPWLDGIGNIVRFTNITKDQVLNHSVYEYTRRFIHQRACQMSYGQRRLVELFRAVLYKPKIILLDEPFNFMDPTSRELFNRIIFDESSLKATSNIILTTHYAEDFQQSDAAVYEFDNKFPINRITYIKR